MVEKVFVKSKDDFIPVELEQFEKEKPLRKIIIKNPELIPLDQINPRSGSKFFPISSELDTDHGNLDVIGVDQSGNIYIIETKLYDNHDRRHITAQVWDYAGGLLTFSDDFEEFKDRIYQANQTKPNEGTKLEGETLEKIIGKIPDLEDEFIVNIKSNFENANYSYILVLDKIDQKLKEDLKLHNKKDTNPMYAVTISKFKPKGSNDEIVISTIYGTELAKENPQYRNWKKWLKDGETEFLRLLNTNPDLHEPQKDTVRKLFYELKEILGGKPNSEKCDIGYYDWGQTIKDPRFSPKFYKPIYDLNKEATATFTLHSNGNIRIRYPNHTATENERKFEKTLTHELEKIPCFEKISARINLGEKELKWLPEEWLPCADEFMKAIKKVCVDNIQ